jgi:hypothetical protein
MHVLGDGVMVSTGWCVAKIRDRRDDAFAIDAASADEVRSAMIRLPTSPK